MNQLIIDIFGDGYISLTCEGGECLHYTQVPGYKVNMRRTVRVLLTRLPSVASTQAKAHELGRSECSRCGTHISHCLGWYDHHSFSSIPLKVSRTLVYWSCSF